ncbi:cobalamin biosynthesis protein [Salinarimonas sp.]|uniref:cobalamin biosynthesis protein n=1 Tax=Salinarimonas sp. TaxID=2766526 RepID=UPI0032D98F29
MIVAGVGLSSAARAQDIIALVGAAGVQAGVRPTLLASVVDRATLPAFEEAARALKLPVMKVSAETLAAAAERVETQSPRAQEAHGVGSVAEAAALAAAGADSTLLLARITGEKVTCAIARGEEAAS